jgi:hypothetical protein
MKTKTLLILLLSVCFTHQLPAQALTADFLFGIEADLNPPQLVGPVLRGTRVILLVKDSRIKSSQLSGSMLPGSGDWGLLVDSTTFKIDARTTIKTDDGALIYMTYSGFIHAEAQKLAMLLGGRANEVSPANYYFRINPVFETSSPKYAWLNHTLAIGIGRMPSAGKVTYQIYAIK